MLTFKEIHKIDLYQKTDKGSICLLCPHQCFLKPQEIGKCGVRKCSNLTFGDIYCKDYGVLSLIAVDTALNKPFKTYVPLQKQKDYKILSVGGFGCTLSCSFCENHKISQDIDYSIGSYFSVADIIKFAEEKSVDAICMTYSEPTIYYEYLLDLSDESRKKGFKFLLKTNAYVNSEPWKKICSSIDAVNIDFKGSKKNYKDIAGADSYVIYERIAEAIDSGINVEISIPLYKGIDFDEIDILSDFLLEKDNSIGIHLLKINPAYKCINSYSTPDSRVKRAQNIFDKKFKNVFID